MEQWCDQCSAKLTALDEVLELEPSSACPRCGDVVAKLKPLGALKSRDGAGREARG